MSRYWAGPWSSERNNRGWSNHLVREARGIPIVFALYVQKMLKSWTHYLKCLCLSFLIVKVGISESTSRIIIRFKWSKPGMYPKKCLEQVSVTQSCLTLCSPMDYNPPDSSVHGIHQARILEWVVILFSRGSSQPRGQTCVYHISGRFFSIWATREAWHHQGRSSCVCVC